MPFVIPRPSTCPECKAKNGMDRCTTCEGTGTVFKVEGSIFPDTKEGFKKAQEKLTREPFNGTY